MDNSNALANIIEVHELFRGYEVNKYLALGWVLLSVCAVPGYGAGGGQTPLYILGWSSARGNTPKMPEYEMPNDSDDVFKF